MVGIGFVHSLGDSGMGGVPGTGMFAGSQNKAAGSTWYRAKVSDLEHGVHVHQNGKKWTTLQQRWQRS